MWEAIAAFVGIASLIRDHISDKRAKIAAEEAEMWRSVFWIAVIVIAVLAFILWRKHRNSVQAINKPEERWTVHVELCSWFTQSDRSNNSRRKNHNLFSLAVIVIAVLAFLTYKKSHNSPTKSWIHPICYNHSIPHIKESFFITHGHWTACKWLRCR